MNADHAYFYWINFVWSYVDLVVFSFGIATGFLLDFIADRLKAVLFND